MRVLIAPQEFKGSLTAVQAADAIERGIRSRFSDAELDLLPMSDGGPGFLEAIHASTASTLHHITVRDPIQRSVEAAILEAGDTIFVESAEANGLWRLAEPERDPLYASTEGVGDLLLAAAALHPSRIVIGVGGSATNDGGSGMARALGARFFSMDGAPLPPGAAPLADLARIDWQRPNVFDRTDIVVATDVTNPLLGAEGAARVFGPQKGATPGQVDAIDAALFRYAGVLRRALGADVGSLRGAGAAGGLGAGLIAFLGARVASGFDVVAQAVGLEDRLRAADLVVTGEGSYDAQSAMGKVTHRIREQARASGIPCLVLAGRSESNDDEVHTLTGRADDDADAIDRAASLLEEVAADAAGDALSANQ